MTFKHEWRGLHFDRLYGSFQDINTIVICYVTQHVYHIKHTFHRCVTDRNYVAIIYVTTFLVIYLKIAVAEMIINFIIVQTSISRCVFAIMTPIFDLWRHTSTFWCNLSLETLYV